MYRLILVNLHCMRIAIMQYDLYSRLLGTHKILKLNFHTQLALIQLIFIIFSFLIKIKLRNLLFMAISSSGVVFNYYSTADMISLVSPMIFIASLTAAEVLINYNGTLGRFNVAYGVN